MDENTKILGFSFTSLLLFTFFLVLEQYATMHLVMTLCDSSSSQCNQLLGFINQKDVSLEVRDAKVHES